MEEGNSISQYMDVKVDLKERKSEFLALKTWTRFFVKIEAIKCFPCYIKISLFKNINAEDTNLVFKINIPGLNVQQASSRTKQFTCGLFWKNNRKKCCAFFALDSKICNETTLMWMQKSIRNLELFRQEFILSRRASRCQSIAGGNESSIYQNLNQTDTVKDVNELLGPLPKIPDAQSNENWSRRVSGYSIYEEIRDSSSNNARMSRVSVASGIYEEMKLGRLDNIDESVSNTSAVSPPPLPPRTRTNTTESNLHRSNTNPECDYLTKKKSWNLFENVFQRKSKRNNSQNSLKSSNSSESDIVPQLPQIKLLKSKRNSFSSPDLSHLYCNNDPSNLSNISAEEEQYHSIETDNLNASAHMSTSNSFNIPQGGTNENLYQNDSMELPMSISPISRPESLEFPDCAFVEHQIIQGQLVETPLKHRTDSSDLSSPDLSGYLPMDAGKGFNKQQVLELDQKLKSLEQTSFLKIEYQFSNPISPITFKREHDYDSPRSFHDELIYMQMEKPKEKRPKEMAVERRQNTENIRTEKLRPLTEIASNTNRNSIDDKVSSYFPNSYYRSSKEASIKKTQPLMKKTPETERKKGSNKKLSRTRSPCCKNKCGRLNLNSSIGSNNSIENSPFNESTGSLKLSKKDSTPKLNLKYATIARVPSSPASIATATSKNNISSKKVLDLTPTGSKRFASLPRFKKFDFSPLRMKINQVLQRTNSGGL